MRIPKIAFCCQHTNNISLLVGSVRSVFNLLLLIQTTLLVNDGLKIKFSIAYIIIKIPTAQFQILTRLYYRSRFFHNYFNYFRTFTFH